jgi:hypothetical protein
MVDMIFWLEWSCLGDGAESKSRAAARRQAFGRFNAMDHPLPRGFEIELSDWKQFASAARECVLVSPTEKKTSPH